MSDVAEHAHSDPAAAAPPPPAPLSLRAFGQRLTLTAPGDPARRRDVLRRLHQDIEPFLCAHPPAGQGVALDIGADFGAFALPFARSCPGWTVWCLEPDPELFALLRGNIAASGLGNLQALPLAVGEAAAGVDLAPLEAALRAGDAAAVQALCPPGADSAAGVLPAAALAALAPRLVKLAAPGREAAILEALREAPLDLVLGGLAAPVPSRWVHRPGPGLRQAWLPLPEPTPEPPRGAPRLALRRGRDLSGRRPGLDIVVAMYNSAAFVEECVASLLDNDMPDLRVRVVDDGSTDDGAARLRAAFGPDARLILHHKRNGGCASARNHGRLMSDATHIAFVDADDRVDVAMFPQLLELARHTGAEVVQAGFAPLERDAEGGWSLGPDPEADMATGPEAAFGAQTVRVVPAAVAMTGQPTIWRRVYRRDFLDHRAIWFPEHIRAFDDQIFQLLTLHHAVRIPTLGGLFYHYRQHPGQDIRQGDERAFYSLEMFRLVLKRALAEGWRDCAPLIRSFVNTVNWSHAGLRPDLQSAFLIGAAELWVWMEKALPGWHFRETGEGAVAALDFPYHTRRFREALEGLPASTALAHLDTRRMHVAMMRMPPPAPVPTPVPLPLQAVPDGVRDGAVIILRAAAAEEPRYLDGDVPGQRVVLAPSTEPPFTGTRWTLRRGLDGGWLLLNQGVAEQCLAVGEGGVTLAPLTRPGEAALRWQLRSEGEALMLGLAGAAPGVAGWLCMRPDGMPGLCPEAEARLGAGLWRLE